MSAEKVSALLRTLLFLSIALGLVPGQGLAAALSKDMESFVQEMVDKHGFEAGPTRELMAKAELKESIIKAMKRPAETKMWFEYRPIFVTRSRIQGGINYWNRYESLLERAQQTYGVDAKIIVAIIGVETRYGNHAGKYRVLDALRTLAFDYPPRSAFFRKELEQFLLLAREEDVDVESALGSYAGAMGHGQFIPSSYRRYAVDFDNDGKRDLWNSPADVIGSVANYLSVHGWKKGEAITIPADVRSTQHTKLLDKGLKPHAHVSRMRDYGVESRQPIAGDPMATLMAMQLEKEKEYWIGLPNFYVITRYNHSHRYAMAVYQLADEIEVTRRINQEE